MRLLSRLKQGLSALLAPADDPRATTASPYERQAELLARLREALDEIGSSKRQLELRTERMRARLPEINAQARQALEAGREDLARLALERQQAAAAELRRLEAQIAEIGHEEARLSSAEQRLTARLESLRMRHELADARYTAAEAQLRVGEALAGLSDDLHDFGRALEEAESRTEYMQARAAAIDELIASGHAGQSYSTLGDVLDQEASRALEEELETMRRESTREAR